MDNDFIFPKSGVIANYEKFPTLGSFSFSVGIAKEPHYYCTDGYDKPYTHEGFSVYFYAIFFRHQITFGYNYVKEVTR